MPIFEYLEGDHPAHFVGLRVAVSINCKVKQKYFSYTKKQGYKDRPSILHSDKEISLLRLDAIKLDNQWIEEQLKYKKVRNTFGKPYLRQLNRQWDTGVRGLTCRYIIKDRRTPNKSLVFTIGLFSTNECFEKFQLTRRVPDESVIETEWRKMTRKLALSRGLTRTPPKWNKAMPSVQDRAKMRRKAARIYLK